MSSYNPDSVNKAIAASGRHGQPIGGREARMIHALLRGRESVARAGVQSHHADVPAKGGGGHGGNPNHDEHGRFA